MQDERIVEAHRKAAAVALKELEAFAATRVRKAQAMDDRVTGSLVGAAFFIKFEGTRPAAAYAFRFFNATFDPVEHRWKALQTSGMFAAIHYGTAVYRNELAQRLHGLGYDTRQTAHGFEVAGVEQKLIERFSKRSQERSAAVAKEEKRLGRSRKNEVSHLVHQCRSGSSKTPRSRRCARRSWTRLASLRSARCGRWSRRQGGSGPIKETVHLGVAMDYAIKHVFARKSVAPEHELFEAALVKGLGQIDLPELKEAFARRPGSSASARVFHAGDPGRGALHDPHGQSRVGRGGQWASFSGAPANCGRVVVPHPFTDFTDSGAFRFA